MDSPIDFKLFLVIWNQRMGMSTPAVHLKIAGWLEGAWRKGDRRLLLMAFRSCGKSTLVGLFSAWLLYCKPELRIMVVAAEQNLATKMVRNVRRILERHPLTSYLKPDKPDQWAGERFTVRRDLELRDPSMLAKGVSANITGSRADIIIYDDVEVPNTCDSADKREVLRERLAEIAFVLTPGGTQLYVGTPHSYYSIYAEDSRVEVGEEDVFLSSYKRLKIPVLGEGGESVWPERYSREDIAQIKRQSGPNKFMSQMMLEPVNITEGRLDPSLMKIYSDPVDYTREIRTLFIGSTKMVSASAFWDPAFGSAKGDHSVFAVVFADADGSFYLHRVEYIKNDPKAGETDEATYQCRRVAQVVKELYLPSLSVEINGIGRFLPSILRNELVRAHAPCAVSEVSNTRAKDLRILEAFDAVLAAGRLHVHESVLKTPFAVEMAEWRPGGAGKGHDDGLDAVAGALLQQPVRLKRLYRSSGGGHSWMGGGGRKSHQAGTEFDV